MAIWDFVGFTDKAQEYLAKIQSGRGSISISNAKSGSVYSSNPRSLQVVLNPVQDVGVVSVVPEGIDLVINLQLSNMSLTESYKLYQIGIYATYTFEDTQEDFLYILAQCRIDSADSIPAMAGSPVLLHYKMHISNSNSDNIQVSIEPEGFVTFEELERSISNIGSKQIAEGSGGKDLPISRNTFADFSATSMTSAQFMTSLPTFSSGSFTHSKDLPVCLTDCPNGYGQIVFWKGYNNNYCSMLLLATNKDVYKYSYNEAYSANSGWDKLGFNDDILVKNKTELLNLIYPVGSIYMSVNNVSPQTFLGGTWVAWGAGRMPVSVNTSDSSFNTVEKTGGNKNAVIPYHNHSVNAVEIESSGSHRHYGIYGDMPDGTNDDKLYFAKNAFPTSGGGKNGVVATTTDYGLYAGSSQSAHTHDVPKHNTNYAGTSGNTTNANLPPYITCFMWKRTK